MANIKQVLGGAVTRAFGQQALVHHSERLSPNIVRVQLKGAALTRIRWSPGDKIKLRVADGVMRSYTPSRVDTASGAMELIIHAHHGGGPGARWAGSLRGGEPVAFFGPAPSMPRGVSSPEWAVFLGDETAIGLARALREALPANTPISGAIELAPEDRPAVAALALPLDPVARRGEHGDALVTWLEKHIHEIAERARPGVIWLSGEVNGVVRLRDTLRARGLERPTVLLKPYWSLRGAAHRKQVERRALAS